MIRFTQERHESLNISKGRGKEVRQDSSCTYGDLPHLAKKVVKEEKTHGKKDFNKTEGTHSSQIWKERNFQDKAG